MKTNLLAGSLDFSSLCSNPENCLCWLIILLDIFAIFYLVFVSFYRVTKLVRMVGWIWLGVLITADVIIVAIHPCILTLLCILFTIMIMTAMLSVVLPNMGYEINKDEQQVQEKPKKQAKCGSYVVREIGRNKFCFEIYDKQNIFLVRSYDCYKTVADVKQAIAITRTNGEIAELEDRTGNWIKEANHPKFEMYAKDESYYFKLTANETVILFESKAYATIPECKKDLNKAMACVQSTAVYLSVEKLLESDAKYYDDKIAISFDSKQPEPTLEEKTEVKEEIAPQVSQNEVEAKIEDGAVVINTSEKKTLWESYEELPKEQKAFFDGLRKAAQEKEGSREYESSSQLSYVLFKDKLMRIQIRRNTVEAIFMLMDATFKQMQNAGDIKIKDTKTVVKIENAAYYALALETLDKKYNLLLEQKAERENQRKLERQEKSRLKRLENKKQN